MDITDYRRINRVWECVEDKERRKQLFDILRNRNYVDPFVKKLHEWNLYDEFEMLAIDIYDQLFDEWVKKNGLNFL